ncbi:MAG: hypothetical protein U0792_25350 [Gemmataceae bacterium]
MTGQFTVVPANTPSKITFTSCSRLLLCFELRLRDPRRFGAAEYFPSRAAVEEEMNADLGPEPFGMDADTFRAPSPAQPVI